MALEYFRQIRVFMAEHLDPQASALAFANHARGAIEDMIRAKQVPERYVKFTDGRQGIDERQVKPGGTIAYQFSYNADVLVFALAFLYQRSPTGSAAARGPRLYRQPFRESFWVSINGKYIRPGALNLMHVPDGPAELIVGNAQPYARKIDTQRIGNKVLRFNKPERLYRDAARAINQAFGNSVTAKAVHDINFPEKYRLKQRQMRTGTRSHNIKREAGEYVESPALIINPR